MNPLDILTLLIKVLPEEKGNKLQTRRIYLEYLAMAKAKCRKIYHKPVRKIKTK